ncbi:HAMP domain-containing histidine kinase [Flavobacteriaceae bacterium F89]|uniref:histidine kinase n=1 Tax=Cerina litoralis TaxID=2874477 RepID=A0AAE3EUH8_9FLAO|nr:HAMP domain-containing sensor histidine kinase [Cerina litoralis]MCG2460374.1 HAMP domain-containing histidine kinase [Cerina litoralis]
MSELKNKIGLLRKASKTFLWISTVLMLAGTVALYFYTKKILQGEAEEELYSTEARIEDALASGRELFSLPPVMEIVREPSNGFEILKDTVIYDPSQDEMELFRELSTYRDINGQIYKITVRSLIVETEDILMAIVLSYVIILLLAFLFLYYFNSRANERLWMPFFHNLNQMKGFQVTSKTPLELKESNILEFSELSEQIRLWTDKVRADYENLKQFTEDVSHEIQTPLAIIQAKIENLINDEKLDQGQYEDLTSLQKDIQRLAQLNKRLTLLTKIDNQQFINAEHIHLVDCLEKSIDDFREISTIEIDFIKKDDIIANMDSYLANVLFSNLISNAIRHSPHGTGVHIVMKDGIFSISNHGHAPLKYPEKLFNRFYRESAGTKSTGLGLAIVKKICDMYGFGILYRFKDSIHIFEVDFRGTL